MSLFFSSYSGFHAFMAAISTSALAAHAFAAAAAAAACEMIAAARDSGTAANGVGVTSYGDPEENVCLAAVNQISASPIATWDPPTVSRMDSAPEIFTQPLG